MLVAYAVLFVANCLNNPFSDKIKPDISTFIISSTLLTRDDYKYYLIYEETHKIVNPESFSFLDYKTEFIAFKSDTLNNISSILLYIHDTGDLISTLKKEFGDSYSSFTFTGEMTGTIEQKMTYETFIWKIDGKIMLIAPYLTINDNSSQREKLTRIWIKNI